MPNHTFGIVLGAFASFAGFLYGYDTGYISGCKEMPYFKQTFGSSIDGTYQLSTATDSLITSILSAGTLFGALAASTIGDALGRRLGIIAYIFIFFAGVAMQTGGRTMPLFAAGRVLAGLGVGGTSVLVPIYQAECAPRHLRGIIVSAYQLCITVGLLVAAVVVNATKDLDNAGSFAIPIGIQFIWGTILVIGLVFLPESPRWLVLRGRVDDAVAALSRLMGSGKDSTEVRELYEVIAANLEHARATAGGRWSDCFRGGESKTRRRILTGMGIQALQQLSGINFIFYYGTSFFTNSGISNPFLITIATNVVNTGMTVVGMIATDRIGRRSLTLYGAVGMAISQLVVASIGAATATTNVSAQMALVAFVCIYIANFAVSWGVTGWILTAEIYPYALRAKGVSLSTGTQWLFNFAIGYATPYMANTGPGNAGLQTNVFWIWSGFCCIAVIFTYFLVPETKGLTLEQVDLIYRKSTPRQSPTYRKEILALNLHDSQTENGVQTPPDTENKVQAKIQHLDA